MAQKTISEMSKTVQVLELGQVELVHSDIGTTIKQTMSVFDAPYSICSTHVRSIKNMIVVLI